MNILAANFFEIKQKKQDFYIFFLSFRDSLAGKHGRRQGSRRRERRDRRNQSRDNIVESVKSIKCLHGYCRMSEYYLKSKF